MNVNHMYFVWEYLGIFALNHFKWREDFYAQYKMDNFIFCDVCQKGKDIVGSQSNLWRVIFLATTET